MVSENGRARATRAPRKSDYYFSRLLPLRHLGSRQMDEWASPAPSYRFSGFRRSLEELESSGRGRGLSIDGRPTRPTMPSRRPTTLPSQGQAGGIQVQVRLPNTRENRRERRRPRAPVLLHKLSAERTALSNTLPTNVPMILSLSLIPAGTLLGYVGGGQESITPLNPTNVRRGASLSPRKGP
jgi:hypothetical protein